jgi:hypothetical protein
MLNFEIHTLGFFSGSGFSKENDAAPAQALAQQILDSRLS